MLEAFSAYIKNIAIFMLFAAFAQLLLPENNFKKYISLIMGLLLMTAVLKPMLLLFQKDNVLELDAIQKTLSIWSSAYNGQSNTQQQWNDEMILDIYKKELEQKWTEELQHQFHTNEISVSTEFYNDDYSITITGVCENGEEMKQYMQNHYDIEQVHIKGS